MVRSERRLRRRNRTWGEEPEGGQSPPPGPLELPREDQTVPALGRRPRHERVGLAEDGRGAGGGDRVAPSADAERHLADTADEPTASRLVSISRSIQDGGEGVGVGVGQHDGHTPVVEERGHIGPAEPPSGLDGDTGVFFFTDRFASTTSDAISFFWGTRIAPEAPDVSGDWHVFTQHVIRATSQTLNPNNVGRAFAGSMSIDGAAAVTGQGTESTKVTIQLTGTAPSFTDGRVNLLLDFKDAQSTDHREFKCSAGTATGTTLSW